MSYLVLARRWRPLRFDEIVGQPHVVRTLLNGLRQKRLAHAYTFAGPRGVGKTTTARLLARAINCQNPQDGEPCGKCHPCIGIAAGHFIDTIEIDAASNTGVDDIRKLRDAIRYAPIEGKAKVYIIDEVHMLSQGAFNALLKTLEEPPEHAYFCLATTEAQKIPATILSRCQRFDFRRVPVADIRDHLKKICEKDNIEYQLEALDIISSAADGSVRDSLSLMDQVIAFSSGRVFKEDAVDVIGEVKHYLYSRAVKLVSSGSTADAFALDAELASIGTNSLDYITGLENFLVTLLKIKACGIENADIPPETSDDFSDADADLNDTDIIRLLQFCSAAETDVRRNYNPRTRIQLLLLKFASFEKSVVLRDIISRVENTSPTGNIPRNTGTSRNNQERNSHLPETPAQVKPVQKPAATNTGIDSPVDNPLTAVQEAWVNICERISEEHNSRGNMIRFGGFPMEYNDGRLEIHFTTQSLVTTARECLPILKREIERITGDIQLDLSVGEIPSREEEPAPEKDDPAVKKLIDRFGGHVV